MNKIKRCKNCRNKLGHISFSSCISESGKFFCFDFFIVGCWWCGDRIREIVFYSNVDEQEKKLKAREWMNKTIDLKKIGITEQCLGGTV